MMFCHLSVRHVSWFSAADAPSLVAAMLVGSGVTKDDVVIVFMHAKSHYRSDCRDDARD